MKLLIIDPDITPASPAMKGVLRSFAQIRDAGFEIEVWCWRCDHGIDPDRVVKLPSLGARLLGPLQAIVFSVLVSLRSLWVFGVMRGRRPDVIYSIVPYLAGCDVAHAHFSPWDWERRMKELGNHTLKDWLERTANLIIRWWTGRFVRATGAARLLTPSDAVAADFRARAPQLNITVLPNSYDPARFNLDVRDCWRHCKREKLGFDEADRVFVFVSTGHYRRKGFFLAVDAIEKVRRRHPCARLLVVGGQPRALAGLKRRLHREHPHWESWLRFTGSVSEPEQYLAAADAFLFPSYSEAFALVEVEAAACGLPLFLTRHHGSEMVLEDGVNGRFVEFDSDRIAAVLAEFIRGEWKPRCVSLKRALDRSAYASALVEALRSAARPPTTASLSGKPAVAH